LVIHWNSITRPEVSACKNDEQTLYQVAKCWVIYVCQGEEVFSATKETEPNPQLKSICDEFAQSFEDVKGLPPKKSHDLHIVLLLGTEPINQRPYRHPWE